MPNVINNSWGRTFAPDDSVACDGWVNDLFINVEIAGIVSIHSAGNSGPGVSTIGYPSVSNASVVNTFSVGAVNGNTPTFPIASFSSRGPTICGDTGALLIKPEVVAPGVNVRSSIREADGSFTFSNFQGTSMAAPHVSGISLLLMEAFPLATATEIKESLYYSAIDLGVPGEDNTYGRGMIDAMAAFRYLAVLYTPSTVPQTGFDIHLSSFNIEEYSFQCEIDTIKAYFENTQSVPNGSLQFEYGVVGKAPQYFNKNSGTFFPNDSISLFIGNQVSPGWNEFYVKTASYGQMADYDSLNNTRYIRFWVNEVQNLPFNENFDTLSVFEGKMFVGNPDQAFTWDTNRVQGIHKSSNAAMMALNDYTPRISQRDYLQTPNIKLNSPNSITLTFDLSYKLKFKGFTDSLLVSVSTDCGDHWDPPVYAKGPEELNSTTKINGSPWIPVDSSDWRTEGIDLSAYKNASSIQLKFETVNGNGDNLYLDNINLFDENGPVTVADLELVSFYIYPNPNASGELHFSKEISGEMYSITGVNVLSFESSSTIDISQLNKGVYFVVDENNNEFRKLIIQ
jgi:hypothetical protein